MTGRRKGLTSSERGLAAQNRKNCLSAEKLSSPLNRPFSLNPLIQLEI
jgi:hypothetical protein